MSVSKWAYNSAKCDGDYCCGSCDNCPKAEERGERMTLEECIDYAEEQSKWMSKYAMIDIYKDRSEYYQQLAEWLKELKEIRRKPEPRLVNYESDGDADGFPVYDYARCPNCDHWFEDSDDSWEANYCPYCGQALKWEVKTDDES